MGGRKTTSDRTTTSGLTVYITNCFVDLKPEFILVLYKGDWGGNGN